MNTRLKKILIFLKILFILNEISRTTPKLLWPSIFLGLTYTLCYASKFNLKYFEVIFNFTNSVILIQTGLINYFFSQILEK